MSSLATRSFGTAGPHVMFLHGLFGQGRNFTTVANALAASGHRVTVVDLPNHGHSPWIDTQDYATMAGMVAELITEPVVLVGHSMGGKTAMTVALRHSELLSGLVVVDISPVDYPPARTDDFGRYVAAMRALDLDALADRRSADAALVEAVPTAGTRAFLLQSLVRDGSSWRWRLNLDVLARSLDELAGFPVDAGDHYDGPVLWIAGADSAYVREEYRPAMDQLFTHTRLIRIKAAGHWVHAEQPDVFGDVVTRFVDLIATGSAG